MRNLLGARPVYKEPSFWVMAVACVAIVALCAFAGCAAPLPTAAQEDEAVREVWLQNHGPSLARFPDSYRIVWEPSCVVPPGGNRCVDGYVVATHERLGDRWHCEIHVRWTGKISMTELCHEIGHCLGDVNGQRDPLHEDAEAAEAVLRAERALGMKGL